MFAFQLELTKLIPEGSLSLSGVASSLAAARGHDALEAIKDLEHQVEGFAADAKPLLSAAKRWTAALRADGSQVPTDELTSAATMLQMIEDKQASDLKSNLVMLEQLMEVIAVTNHYVADRLSGAASAYSDYCEALLETIQELRWATILAADAREPTGPITKILSTPEDVRALFAELDEPA